MGYDDTEQNYHEPDPEKTRYYLSTDIIFVVEHSADQFNGDHFTTTAFIEALPEGYTLPGAILDSIELVPVVRLSALEGRYNSIFCIRSKALNDKLVFAIYKQFRAAAPKKESNTDSNPDMPLVGGSRLDIPLVNGMGTIRQIMPNWLNAAASHVGFGPHGPGGPARPVKNPAKVKNLRFVLPDALEKMVPSSSAQNVVVYILDTIPEQKRIENATKQMAEPDNFRAILEGVSISNVEYKTAKATYIYANPTQDFPLKTEHGDTYAPGNHDYDSSDHGLFVAGIVHSIVPQVQIYVIQVMNSFGVGTIMDFAAGFSKVADIHRHHHPAAHAIVNCSFTLSIPIDGHDNSHMAADLKTFEDSDQGFGDQIDFLMKAINTTLSFDAVVLAAAGNDSHRTATPATPAIAATSTTPAIPAKPAIAATALPARYPAQFEKVIGVGALRRNQSDRADYSNVADKPVIEGIYTFGGDYDNHAAKTMVAGREDYTDSGKGIIGIFTGDLNITIGEHKNAANDKHTPDNPTGYAEWKGTSFATPIVAGALAKLWLSTGGDSKSVLTALKNLCVRVGNMLDLQVEQTHS